jgi:NTE family protein
MPKNFDFSEVRLLQSLHPETLQKLKDFSICRKYSSGKIIFSEGAEPQGLYFLASGKVGIYKQLKDDSAILLHTVAPHQLFGEVSLMNKTVYRDFARADKDSEVIFIKKQSFEKIVRQDTNASFAISMSLSQKLTELRTQIISQQNKTTIAVFANDGPQQEKAWLAIEVAVSLKEQTEKKVLLIDLLSNPQTIEHVLQKKFDYDFILINLPLYKDALSSSLMMQADFIFNLGETDLSFYQKLYKPELRIVSIDLANDRRLDRLEWRIGNLARVIARRTIGLALGSGTVGGLAHIGVFKYLEEKKIPIDMISGCSGGALYGAIWVHTKSSRKLEKIVSEHNAKDFFDFSWSIKGFFNGRKLEKEIELMYGKNFKIQDMRIPFKIVSTNLLTGGQRIFDTGKLWLAIRSSVAIPIVFTPILINNEWFSDGNIIDPLPVDVLRGSGMDKIIAVYASQSNKIRNQDIGNFMQVFFRARAITSNVMAFENAKKADVFINPDVSRFGMFDYDKYKELIRCGYVAIEKEKNKIALLCE